MNVQSLKVLLIEDSPDDARLIDQMLKLVKPVSFDLVAVDRLEAGRSYLAHHTVDAVLLDLSLPDSQGLETLAGVQSSAPTTAIVVLTGFDDYQLGIEAVNNGAQDCLVKGRVDGKLLSRAIIHSVERARSALALLESESKFRSVIEQSVDGIVLIDEDGIVIEWNRACKAPKVRTIQKWKGQGWFSAAAKAMGVAPPKAA
jgi:DNA-binding NarL/FixJ family response regulator